MVAKSYHIVLDDVDVLALRSIAGDPERGKLSIGIKWLLKSSKEAQHLWRGLRHEVLEEHYQTRRARTAAEQKEFDRHDPVKTKAAIMKITHYWGSTAERDNYHDKFNSDFEDAYPDYRAVLATIPQAELEEAAAAGRKAREENDRQARLNPPKPFVQTQRLSAAVLKATGLKGTPPDMPDEIIIAQNEGYAPGGEFYDGRTEKLADISDVEWSMD